MNIQNIAPVYGDTDLGEFSELRGLPVVCWNNDFYTANVRILLGSEDEKYVVAKDSYHNHYGYYENIMSLEDCKEKMTSDFNK